MKVCILQPEYSVDYSRSDEMFDKQLALLGQCDDSMDIIVMPECCDVPCMAQGKEDGDASAKYRDRLMTAAA